jgi:RimJ/RimL family protein N-acetyltransferase
METITPRVLNSKTNFNMKTIRKYGIILRLVEESDAEFILKLRTNSLLNKYISPTSHDLSSQISWIKDYKMREKSSLEFYFIAEDYEQKRYGTIRLYNFDKKSFEIGSWVFDTNSPLGMAVKAHFIGFETGFEMLKAEYCRFEIRKKNTAVLRYMKDFKTTLVNEDDLNLYYILTKENFYIRKNEISFFLNSNI